MFRSFNLTPLTHDDFFKFLIFSPRRKIVCWIKTRTINLLFDMKQFRFGNFGRKEKRVEIAMEMKRTISSHSFDDSNFDIEKGCDRLSPLFASRICRQINDKRILLLWQSILIVDLQTKCFCDQQRKDRIILSVSTLIDDEKRSVTMFNELLFNLCLPIVRYEWETIFESYFGSIRVI